MIKNQRKLKMEMKTMSEVETAVQEPEVEVNPLADLVDAALAKDYNKANEIFGSAISVKLSDVMDQERIKVSGVIFNGDEEDEDDMEDDEDVSDDDDNVEDPDLEDDSEDDDEDDQEDLEVEGAPV